MSIAITINTMFHEYDASKSAINMLPYVPSHDSLLSQDKRLQREEILKFQNRDLHKLLTCKNHKFWMLVFRDPSILIFLETYLKNANRPFDTHAIMNDNDADVDETLMGSASQDEEEDENELDDMSIIGKLESLMYRRVFMIFWRMVNDRIKQDSDKHSHGQLMKKNELITVPKLLDICALYGYSNINMTRRLFSRLLIMCPEYLDDVNACFTLMYEPLVSLIEECDRIEGGDAKKKSIRALFRHLNDSAHYLYDISFTIRSLVDVVPFASFAFVRLLDSKDILQLLTTLYERTSNSIEGQVDSLMSDLSKHTNKEDIEFVNRQSEIIRFQLNQIKLNILSIHQTVFTECFIDPFLETTEDNDSLTKFYGKYFKSLSINDSTENMDQIQTIYEKSRGGLSVDQLLNSFISLLSKLIVNANSIRNTPILIVDYDKLFQLQQALRDIEDYSENQEIKSSMKSLRAKLAAQAEKCGIDNSQQIQEQLDDDEMEALITVKEIFPDYGNGFLLMCLDHYQFNTQKMTEAILNEKLPKYLMRMDRQLSHRAQHRRVNVLSLVKNEPVHPSEISNVQTPTNTDVVSPAVWEEAILFGKSDKVQVYIGKKNRRESIDVIDEGLRQRIVENYMYDDEYDDSYDNILQLGDDDMASDDAPILAQLDSDTTRDNNRSATKAKQPSNQPSNKPAQTTKKGQTRSNNSSGSLSTSSKPYNPPQSADKKAKDRAIIPPVEKKQPKTPAADISNINKDSNSTKANKTLDTSRKNATTAQSASSESSSAQDTTPRVSSDQSTRKGTDQKKMHEKQKRKKASKQEKDGSAVRSHLEKPWTVRFAH